MAHRLSEDFHCNEDLPWQSVRSDLQIVRVRRVAFGSRNIRHIQRSAFVYRILALQISGVDVFCALNPDLSVLIFLLGIFPTLLHKLVCMPCVLPWLSPDRGIWLRILGGHRWQEMQRTLRNRPSLVSCVICGGLFGFRKLPLNRPARATERTYLF